MIKLENADKSRICTLMNTRISRGYQRQISVPISVKSALSPATNQRKYQRHISAITFLLAVIFLSTPTIAKGATEFVSVIDTGGTGDYSTLSSWEQFNQTNLTSAATQVFSGTRTNDIADGGITVYLCRGGVYQTHSGTVVHATASQILIETITGAATEQANDIWYTNNTCDSANYFTLSNSGDSAISVASCEASAEGADGTAVIIEGWTTSDTNYIKVYTTQANRHSGVWDEGKYRLELAAIGAVLFIQEEYVKIIGLQIRNTHATIDEGDGISLVNMPATWSSLVEISYCIIHDAGERGIDLWTYDYNYKVFNNIVYNCDDDGISAYNYTAGTPNYWQIYNNTVYGCGEGIRIYHKVDATNNISYDNTTADFEVGDSAGSSNYNFSEDDTAPGANSIHGDTDSKTPDFVSTTAGSEDLHLQSTSDAIDVGTDLSGTFSTDIDSETRTNHSWDIGADEAAEKIYRSVGPSASSYLERGIDGGGNNLNISGSTATFASDLGTDVGVGDVIQYDDDNDGDIDADDSVAFIHGRTSATSFTVKNSTGGTPTATAATDQDWSIFRSYDSLSHAESGDENDSIDDDLEAFENWSAGKDIVASNEQWNIACYNGEGDAADTTAVTINGWTTGENNYIKVYTPTETTEVGMSQRHSGVWDDGKYRLEVNNAWGILIIIEEYTKIYGLQISDDTPNDYVEGIWFCSVGNCIAAYNIVRKTGSGDYGYGIYANLDSGGRGSDIYNNIIYNYISTNDVGIYVSWNEDKGSFIYNNTVVDCATGISNSYYDAVIKNNIVFNCVNDYGASFHPDSEYNAYSEGTDPGSSGVDISSYAGTDLFIDYTGDDFHLKSTSSCKDAGVDLSSDANLSFSDDVDSDTRPSPYWDIGADEYPATVKVEFKGITEFLGNVEIR